MFEERKKRIKNLEQTKAMHYAPFHDLEWYFDICTNSNWFITFHHLSRIRFECFECCWDASVVMTLIRTQIDKWKWNRNSIFARPYTMVWLWKNCNRMFCIFLNIHHSHAASNYFIVFVFFFVFFFYNYFLIQFQKCIFWLDGRFVFLAASSFCSGSFFHSPKQNMCALNIKLDWICWKCLTAK